jgi:hypothetical protein
VQGAGFYWVGSDKDTGIVMGRNTEDEGELREDEGELREDEGEDEGGMMEGMDGES